MDRKRTYGWVVLFGLLALLGVRVEAKQIIPDMFNSTNATYLGNPALGYMSVNASGTPHFYGDAGFWDDLVVDLNTAKVTGATNLPDFTNFLGGLYAWEFEAGDQIFFNVQFPHRWNEGGTVYPHFHWFPNFNGTTCNATLGVEWAWENIGDYYTDTLTSEVTVQIEPGTQFLHTLTNLDSDGFTLPKTGSSIAICRGYRGTSAINDCGGTIYIIDFDIHFESDKFGSDNVLPD